MSAEGGFHAFSCLAPQGDQKAVQRLLCASASLREMVGRGLTQRRRVAEEMLSYPPKAAPVCSVVKTHGARGVEGEFATEGAEAVFGRHRPRTTVF